MAYRGIRDSSIMIISFTVINLIVMGILFSGMIFSPRFSVSNFSPFYPSENPLTNIKLILITVFLIAESLFGFEQVLFLGDETKNPEKVIPKAMIISIIFESVIIILFVIATLGFMNWKVFAGLSPLPKTSSNLPSINSAPYSYISYLLYGYNGMLIFSILIYLVIMGAATTTIVTTPRLLYTLAKDKLFLSSMKELHPKYQSPYKAIIFQTIIISIFALLSLLANGYETLLKLYSPMVLFVIILTEMAYIYFRIKHKKKERPFKLKYGTPIAIFIILFYIGLLIGWMISDPLSLKLVLLGLSFIILGIPIFFLVEFYYDTKAIRKTHDLFAYFALFTERLNLPQKVIDEILALLGSLRGKTVLEYGCGVGTLTKDLARRVGRYGEVYATDLSIKDLLITEKRIRSLVLNKEEIGRVHILHDALHTERIHPDIKYADVVVSVGNISYAKDIKKILRDVYKILPLYGKVCFVEYADYFGIIPNVDWLSSNEEIYHLFREQGFSVRVIRKRRLFWNYVYIYGYKTGNQEIKVL
ncbi:MAG: amino acid permease [Nitrospiraceae bacterium]|nr:amino acid permease [Nitrospiraceae bacterium]